MAGPKFKPFSIFFGSPSYNPSSRKLVIPHNMVGFRELNIYANWLYTDRI
jgi:hypothetical protein